MSRPISAPSPGTRARSASRKAIDARAPQAAVFAGFFGADLKSSGSSRVWVGAALLRPASSWRSMTRMVASYGAPLEVAA